MIVALVSRAFQREQLQENIRKSAKLATLPGSRFAKIKSEATAALSSSDFLPDIWRTVLQPDMSRAIYSLWSRTTNNLVLVSLVLPER
jgi:hypothetical protein